MLKMSVMRHWGRLAVIGTAILGLMVIGACSTTEAPAPVAPQTSAPQTAPGAPQAPESGAAPEAPKSGVSAPAPTSTPKPPAASTRSGGILRVSDQAPSISDSILPQVLGSGFGRRLNFEMLLEFSPKTLAYEGMVAEAWEQSEDGKTWTFTIRKGIMWQGATGSITPEDVKFSLEMWQNGNPAAGHYSEIEQFTNDVKVLAGNKVSTTTPGTMHTIPYLVSNLHSSPIIPRKHLQSLVPAEGDIWAFENYEADPVGSGPYKLIEYKNKEFHKFEAVKKHWRVVPDFDFLEILYVPETSTRVAMLRTGGADIITIGRPQAPEITASGNQVVRGGQARTPVWYWTLGQYHGPSDLTDPNPRVYDPTNPIDNQQFREALSYDIDRDTILDVIFGGYGYSAGAFIIRPEDPPFREEWQPHPYDPAKARAFLKEAGYEGGAGVGKMEIGGYTRPQAPELLVVTETIVDTWKQDLGVEVDIVIGEYSAWRQTKLRGRDGSRFILPFASLLEYPGRTFSIMYTCHGYFGVCGVSEYPETEALFDEARLAPTLAEFGDILGEIQDIIYDRTLNIAGWHLEPLSAVNPDTVKLPNFLRLEDLSSLEYVNIPLN